MHIISIILLVGLFLIMSEITSSSISGVSVASEWKLIEAVHRDEGITNERIVWGSRAAPDTTHECHFFLVNPRQQEMEQLLQEVSDPRSPKYGKHLTHDQVQAMSHNEEGERLVRDFLTSIGAILTKVTNSAIYATAPISVWEAALRTEFFEVKLNEEGASPVLRCQHYSLPAHVAAHITTVMNTIQLPFKVRHGPVVGTKKLPIHHPL